jgi:hypothetical protein
MTLTTLITVNAVLAAVVAYGLHHLLAHGIRSDLNERHEVVALASEESERIAA